MIRLVIFDLDNTLYDELLFLKSAYKNISRYLSLKYNLNELEIYKELLDILEKNDPTFRILDCILEKYKIEKKEIKTLLNIFYNSLDDIEPYEDTIIVLESLKEKGYFLVLQTDGNAELQKKKIEKLGLKEYFDDIIYTDEKYGKIHRKPSPIPLIDIINKFNVPPTQSAFIGDNIFKDFISPNRLEMLSIRILKGIYSKYPNEIVPFDMRPRITLKSLRELLSIF